MTKELQPMNQKPELSKSVNSSKQSQDCKPNGKNFDSSKPILESKAKPFPPCTHCGFDDHHPDDCRNYPEYKICGSYDHFTSGHNLVILVRGGILAESSQSNESSTGRHIREPVWYLDSGCSRSMTGVKSYLHKYVEQPGLKSQHASTSSYPVAQDRWSQNQHIELVNIIGDLSEGMITRSMAAKLTDASVNKCLFADFLSEMEPKKLSEALKHPGWVDSMQEELNQFYKNKV
ncbi:hypothetical protein Tco_0409232 [Tanacetum coccineum]